MKTAAKTQKQAPKTRREERATFILSKELHSKIKAIAYYEREKIKDSIERALNEYIDRYEKQNGREYLELYRKKNS